MLNLIYHTGVFGPIHLAYDRPVIRVGRSEDNDLVLRHPSVEPYHCLLVFRGEKVLCLPPESDISSETDLESLTSPEFGVGDQIRIGELLFSLVHSARSVGIPEVRGQDSSAGASEGDSATGAGDGVSEPRYFCARCRVFYSTTEVKRVGLVGHAKRHLCPKCSCLLDVERELPKPSPGRTNSSKSGWWSRGGSNP